MKPPVEPLTPIPTEARDAYFEYRFALGAPDIEVAGLALRVSDVLQLDPLAYEEARQELLADVWASIVSECDEASVRRLRTLATLIPKGGAIPFVGAGVSSASGYLGWADFLCSLCRDPDEIEAARARIRAGQFDLLASEIRDRLGKNAFDEALQVFDAQHPPSELALLVVSTFRQGVVTTNFDSVLERAFELVDERFSVIEGSGNWSGWAREAPYLTRPLLKLHGHFRRPLHRVLLAEEYASAYGAGGPVTRDMTHLLRSSCLVFIGCSLTADLTLARAKELQENDGGDVLPQHFAFLQTPDSELAAREKFLTERGIFPIWYPNEAGDHILLSDMLWALRCEVELG
ncbi:SIR2 family protein [Microbacterium sp. NPDC089695]|uniref:SIR2 family protein n=1 Tax=Microbacterium sp. NPDC089695 TaxID=3364198 RepID=UPI0037F547AE